MEKSERIKKLKLKMLASAISFICAGILIAISASFAWFASNTKASATGMSVSVANNLKMNFTDNVIAIRHSLSGEVITNTYTRQQDKTLKLTNSSSTKDDYVAPAVNSAFLFDEMLPGEYVDITISFVSLEDTDMNYILSLGGFDLTYGTFTINEVVYDVLGAFKYKPLSVTYYDDSNNVLSSTDYDEDYVWFQSYVAGVNSVTPDHIEIYNGEWREGYSKGMFTFRVYEDFTQYYRLINAIGESVPNQLSEKIFKVGQIRLSKNES